MTEVKPLEPPDLERCQVEKTAAHNFLTFGPTTPKRCPNPAEFVLHENEPGPDGQRGSMSVCDSCLEQFIARYGSQHVSITPIEEWKVLHAPGRKDSLGSPYHPKHIKDLRNPDHAIYYLHAVVLDRDADISEAEQLQLIRIAIADILEAHGGNHAAFRSAAEMARIEASWAEVLPGMNLLM